MSLFFWLRRAVWVAPVLALAACSGMTRGPTALGADFQPENFDSAAYVRHYSASPERTCEAARRALLSQGYVVTGAAPEQVTGRKYFQPNVEHHVQLEFRIVCAPERNDPDKAVVFVSGLQDQYVVRKVKDSASLGVGGFGSLSLPIEGGLDSLVKVSSQTVTDTGLYQRFFDLLATYLGAAVTPAS